MLGESLAGEAPERPNFFSVAGFVSPPVASPPVLGRGGRRSCHVAGGVLMAGFFLGGLVGNYR